MEEVQHVTWDFWGQELSHEQTIQRIIVAGFPIWKREPQPHSPALTMFAIVEGESGEYQRAWHANVDRNDDGTIRRWYKAGESWVTDPHSALGPPHMKVKSIDLGFMQFNVDTNDAMVEMSEAAAKVFVEGMFEDNPDLADPWKAAVRALGLWKVRGFQPWYAYKPGTEGFKKKMTYGALAFSNWLVHSFVDSKKQVVYKP